MYINPGWWRKHKGARREEATTLKMFIMKISYTCCVFLEDMVIPFVLRS